LSILDFILLAVLVIGGYSGYKKGLILELLTFLALILGLVGGFHLMHLGVDLLKSKFDLSGQYLPFLSFILIFVLIVAGVNLLGKALKKIIDMTLLGAFDNLGGALLGILKWGFGISVLIWLVSLLNIPQRDMLADSTLIPYLEPVAPRVMDFVSFLIPHVQDLGEAVEDLFREEGTRI
jgi:membrane protein required for colicin V production